MRTRLLVVLLLSAFACGGDDRPAFDEATLEFKKTGSGWSRAHSLFGEMEGSGSAVDAVNKAYAALGKHLDTVPAKGVSVRDEDNVFAQSGFAGIKDGKPVLGVIVVSVRDGQATVAVTYDDARRAERTVPGSGDIGVPEGWVITGASNGGVDVAGPKGEWVSLGINHQINTGAWRIDPNGFYASYASPGDAIRIVLPRLFGYFRRFNPAMHSLGDVTIIERSPTATPVGEAVYLRFDASLSGKPHSFFALVQTMSVDTNYWNLYFSWISAPRDLFKSRFATMVSMWESWTLNASAHDFAMYIRGTATISNPRTGAQMHLTGAQAKKVLDQLNQQAGFNLWSLDSSRPPTD